MSCEDEADFVDGVPGMTEKVEALFVSLDAAGNERLASIELDILESLRARPRHLWCWAQLALLEGIEHKARGVPWTPPTLGSSG